MISPNPRLCVTQSGSTFHTSPPSSSSLPANDRSTLRKLLLSAAAVALTTAPCHAVTTLQFASSAEGFLTGLANSSGQINQTLVWGIVIDTAGNGVKPGEYLSTSLTYSDTQLLPKGQSLSTEDGTTDDLLLISANLMATVGTADNSTGLAKPTNLNVYYSGDFVDGNAAINSAGGQQFWLIWFDTTTKTGQAVTKGDRYGMYRIPAFEVPFNTVGGTSSYASNFLGPDPANLASLTFVPEPSSALLGLLGAASLLGRRRR